MEGHGSIRAEIERRCDQALMLRAYELLTRKADVREWTLRDHEVFLAGRAAERRLERAAGNGGRKD
jgi:hypothetical protein